MKQLIFIHGGEAFASDADYEVALQQWGIPDPNLVHGQAKQRWHYVPALQEALGDDWQIIRPDMPCDTNAKYHHWKTWFEKYIPHMRDGVVLVGHSLGAMFLSRYLSENKLPVVVSKLLLLAGEFAPADHDRAEYFYTHLDNFKRLDQCAEQMYILHSEDDFVVPFHNAQLFVDHLPSAQLVVFTDRGHFLQEKFPEIIELIKDQQVL